MEQTVITSKTQIETLVRGWIDGLVFQHEVRLARTGGFDFLESDEIAALGKEEAREVESLLRFAGGIHDDAQKKAVDQVLSGMRDPDEFEPVMQSATPAMAYVITPSVARKRSFGKKSGFTPSSKRYGRMLRT